MMLKPEVKSDVPELEVGMGQSWSRIGSCDFQVRLLECPRITTKMCM